MAEEAELREEEGVVGAEEEAVGVVGAEEEAVGVVGAEEELAARSMGDQLPEP